VSSVEWFDSMSLLPSAQKNPAIIYLFVSLGL